MEALTLISALPHKHENIIESREEDVLAVQLSLASELKRPGRRGVLEVRRCNATASYMLPLLLLLLLPSPFLLIERAR